MRELKLNSVSRDVFAVNPNDNETVQVGERVLKRNSIIAGGRLCMAEYFGRSIGGTDYKTRLASEGDYHTFARNHMDMKLLYAAAQAYRAIGKNVPADPDMVRADISIQKSDTFLRALASLDQEIVAPLLFSTLSDLGGRVLNLRNVRLGTITKIDVLPNEAFLWEDTAPGDSYTVTKNYLYMDTVTMYPRAYACDARIKAYQLFANDASIDPGWYYGAIIRGLYSKITALYTKALKDVANDTRYINSYLAFNSYSSANWANATTAAMVANGLTDRSQLMAFGEFAALQKVLPNGTSVDAALTYGLGAEWMRNGFLSVVNKVALYEVLPAMVPGTVNTTGKLIGMGGDIFIVPRAGGNLAPIQGVMSSDSPITFEYRPADGTADFCIDINMTCFMDFKAVMAAKAAVIKNVV